VDPVYTGKALRGLYETAKAKPGYFGQRVLFVHTGGGFGLFKVEEEEWAEK
jgi:1-aminocyclopropane-1-carboxylate deaminase/D-cysteine desulfhydrase-like pyridoxal-dependent ACC family enzyme